MRRSRLTVIAGLVVASGVAGTTLLLSFLDAVLHQPPAGTHPPASALVIEAARTVPSAVTPAWERAARRPESGLQTLACWYGNTVLAEAGGVRIPAVMHIAEAAVPRLLRIQLAAGTLPAASQAPPAMPEVLLGAEVASALGLAPSNAIGQVISLDRTPARVVGVAHPDFAGLKAGLDRRQLWVVPPIQHDRWDPRGKCTSAIALPLDGVSLQMARESILAATTAGAPSSPSVAMSTSRLSVTPLHGIHAGGDQGGAALFYVKYASVIMLILWVLLGLNLFGLHAALLIRRRAEVSVRVNLGGSPSAIGRLLLGDWLKIVGVGTAIGFCVALTVLPRMQALAVGLTIKISPFLVAGVVIVGVVATLATGLVPIRHVATSSPRQLAREGLGTGLSGMQAGQRLVALQVAVAVPVLTAVGMLLWVGGLTRDIDGVHPDAARRLFVVSIDWRDAGEGWRELADSVDVALNRLVNEGQIEAFAKVSLDRAQFRMDGSGTTLTAEGHGITPGQFVLEGRSLADGRLLEWDDTLAVDVPIIVTTSLYDALGLENNSAVDLIAVRGGRREPQPVRVVGRVADDQLAGIGEGTQFLYVERGRFSWREILVRTTRPMEESLVNTQQVLTRSAPTLGVSVQTIHERRRERAQAQLWVSGFSAAFAAACLLIAQLGFFVVTTIGVRHRWRELAVRRALGASPGRLLRDEAAAAFRWAFVGCAAAGAAVLLGGAMFLRSGLAWRALFVGYTGAAVCTCLMMMLATCLSAIPVFTVQPARALRHD